MTRGREGAMMPAVVSERMTLVQHAYQALRAMILGGELPAGTKMVVRPLSDRLGLSATPIKSALAALERDGFLTAVPDRGYFVPEIDLQDMREIYELREALDGLAGRKVALQADSDVFVDTILQPIYEAQQLSVQAGNIVGLRDLDLEFHRAIWHASCNERLAQVADNLGGQIRLAWGRHLPGVMERALHEHLAIMQAIAAHDPAAAERASRAHVRKAFAAFVD